MLPPLPRCSSWVYSSLVSPSRISLPRFHCRVGLHIVLFEVCSAFTHVAACTLAQSPYFVTAIRGLQTFLTSMPAPVASGGSGRRVGLAPTGKAPPYHGAREQWTLVLHAGVPKARTCRRCCGRLRGGSRRVLPPEQRRCFRGMRNAAWQEGTGAPPADRREGGMSSRCRPAQFLRTA